jgi:hypothetical protein
MIELDTNIQKYKPIQADIEVDNGGRLLKMYKLQILGPTGRHELFWDPKKAQARDPETLAALAAANQQVKVAVNQNNLTLPVSANTNTNEHRTPYMAVSGRWTK